MATAAFADPWVGQQVPPTSLTTPSGEVVEWSPGKVTVVSFHALWCDTWRTQATRLDQAQSLLTGFPVRWMRVSIDGRWQDVHGANRQISYSDIGGRWSRSLDVNRVPTTIVIDQLGTVRWVRSGVVRADDVIREVRRIVRKETGSADKIAYLTFDDFPSPRGDDDLLDMLRRENVKATFFAIGSRLEPFEDEIRQAMDFGHQIACHSWSHDAERPELDRFRQAFSQVVGKQEFLYRPPGSEKIIGLSIPYLVVNPYDDRRPGEDEIIRRVLAQMKPGGVIQLHAGVSQTIMALPRIIERLRGLGYRFELLPTPEPRIPLSNSSGSHEDHR